MSREIHGTFMRAAYAAVAVLALGGCMMQNQAQPPLSGPSGFGRQIRLTATPDSLPRDGSSQATIRVTYTDYQNNPLSRRLLLTASSGTLSAPEVTTNSSGQASFVLTAPSLDTPASSVAVQVTPVALEQDSADGANTQSQVVFVNLVGPDVPVASFTFTPTAPTVGTAVTFDASGSTFSGSACGSACDYTWDFGDGTTGSGALAQHTYTTPGVKNVTLTVTGPGGASNSTSKPLAVAAPAAPTANFTVTPGNPSAGVAAVLNASSSTVGTGATIASYDWDFGDGSTASRTIPTTTHTFAAAGPYFVTLTVTDSLGRTATITLTVTVVP